MEPRRTRREAARRAPKRQALAAPRPEPVVAARTPRPRPRLERPARPEPPPRPRRRWRPRPGTWIALGVLTLLVLGAVRLLHRPAGSTRQAQAVRPAASGPAPRAVPVAWGTLPGGGVIAGSSLPGTGGTLWLAAATSGAAGWELYHLSAAGVQGGWTIPTAGGAVHLQTAGGGLLWLSAGPQELAFGETAHTFTPYASAPAADAAALGGFSLGLYLPAGGAPPKTPYVLVAPLGGTSTRTVPLPGAGAAEGTAQTALLPVSGGALALVGSGVWSITPATDAAASWGTLPHGGQASGAAWGDGALWFLDQRSAGTVGIEGLNAAGAVSALPAAAAHPPQLGSGLVFSAGRLWWASAVAVLSDDPTSGSVTSMSLPKGVAGPVLLAPATGGAIWAADGNRFALLPAPP